MTEPLVVRIPSGVMITWPPCVSGENLPKLSCEVSVAVKAEITSANAWAVTLAWLKVLEVKVMIAIRVSKYLNMINSFSRKLNNKYNKKGIKKGWKEKPTHPF
jgi:hypothetical protein